MTSRAEEVLFAYLTDVDALDRLASIGLPEECITTEEMRPVVAWVLDRYFESGRTKAPSVAAIMADWGTVIEQAEVGLNADDFEVEDNIEWAIYHLKNQYVHKQWQEWVRGASKEISEAPGPDKMAVVAEQARELHTLAMLVQSKEQATTLTLAVPERIAAYHERALKGQTHEGMTFGLSDIDSHIFGIHTGELCTCAAGPKVGKSYFCCRVGYHEWLQRRVTVLFTLENSVDMMTDRILCDACGVSNRQWQRGLCDPETVERVEEFRRVKLPTILTDLHIIKPEPGARSVSALVREAQTLGAQSLIIDQLTFIEPPDYRKPRHEQIRDMTHELKTMISTGRGQMSCLLMHQINREGVKAARAAGGLEMYHLAEGSEVERTSDWVLGMYQSPEDRRATMLKFQILASRREDITAWELNWRPSSGVVSVERELENLE